MDLPVGSSLGSCVNVCFGIGNLLAEAKHNKQECLQLVVDCIAVFVEKLPRDAITPGGIRVLEVSISRTEIMFMLGHTAETGTRCLHGQHI